VRGEAWPVAHDGDALCDALLLVGLLHEEELAQPRTAGWSTLLTAAQAQGRVLCIELAGERRWLAIERLPQLLALHPQLAEQPLPPLPDPLKEFDWTAEAALVELLRARLESSGPLDADELASLFALPPPRIMAALLKLEQEGFILRGAFSDPQREQWCERRLLERLHCGRSLVRGPLDRPVAEVLGIDRLRGIALQRVLAACHCPYSRMDSEGCGLYPSCAVHRP